jgi:hypothetical protein
MLPTPKMMLLLWLVHTHSGREGSEAEEGGEEKTENMLKGVAGSRERDRRVFF